MPEEVDFDTTFTQLKEIFVPYEAKLNINELRKLTRAGFTRFTSKKFYSQF